MEDDGSLFIKESKFSDIRPIDGTTRLMVYNSSNIIGLEGLIHHKSKPDGSMIVFTSEPFDVKIKSYERQSGAYLSHLRLFAYIAKKNLCFNQR